MINKKRYFYKLRNIFVLFILFLFQGCANLHANKTKINIDRLTYPAKEVIITYRYTTSMLVTVLSKESRYKLPDSYKNITFVEGNDISDRGYFLDIKTKEDSKYDANVSGRLKASRWTLFFIPYFFTSDSIIYYDLYLDGNLVKRYTYSAENKQVIWTPLIVFFWVSYIYNNFENVMDNITYQFLHDINIENKLVETN